jgi:hypothetical protein
VVNGQTAAFHFQPENATWNIGLGKLEFVNRTIYRHLYHSFYKRFDDIHCPSRFIAGDLRKHGYDQRPYGRGLRPFKNDAFYLA